MLAYLIHIHLNTLHSYNTRVQVLGSRWIANDAIDTAGREHTFRELIALIECDWIELSGHSLLITLVVHSYTHKFKKGQRIKLTIEWPFYESFPLPFLLATYHAVVSLPHRPAIAVAQRTRSLSAVAAAFAAIQRHMVVRPGDATREARSHLDAQLLDGQHIVIGRHIKRAADHQVRERGRHAQTAVATVRRKQWDTDKRELNFAGDFKCVSF